ncbi:MAG TPA: CAP domain-containing protein [Pyrinomonadaceae bacterium]|nr:CAP domain-containing protein [Pyrinomonadaceae bacterium]
MKLRPHAPTHISVFVLLILCALSPARAQQLAAAADASPFDSLAQEVIGEINLARTRPAEYAAYLEQLRPHFNGKEYRRAGRPALLTEEGAAPLEEAIKFLRHLKPLPPLQVAGGLCSGARVLVEDQAATGATGHKGSDGGFCEQRLQRFGSWQGDIGENLTYGPETGRERVLTLLIDDGFANRGHRLRILSPDYKVVGVACGGHKMGSLCVINFAGGFNDGPKAAQPSATQKAAPAPKLPAGARRI